VDNFKKQFTQSAMSQFGSGWTWLLDTKGKYSITSTSNSMIPYHKDAVPLLVLDLWEHAYFVDYMNDRAEYISQWWNVINWDWINERVKKIGHSRKIGYHRLVASKIGFF